MRPPEPRFAPLGDAALTVWLGEGVDPEVNARVHQLAAALRRQALPFVVDVVPAYAALTVFYDPLHTGYETLVRHLQPLLEEESPEEAPLVREVVIPVRYDGPDLAYVAERTGLSEAEVARRHSAPLYRVYLTGFVPGFAYMGELDPALVLPRRETPRLRVPAGSIAIGGAQTGIYPLETPGGWHLIGRTALTLFDARRASPALLRAGDRVRFERLDADGRS